MSVKSSGIVTKKSTPKNLKELSFYIPNEIIQKPHSPERLRTVSTRNTNTATNWYSCMWSFFKMHAEFPRSKHKDIYSRSNIQSRLILAKWKSKIQLRYWLKRRHKEEKKTKTTQTTNLSNFGKSLLKFRSWWLHKPKWQNSIYYLQIASVEVLIT